MCYCSVMSVEETAVMRRSWLSAVGAATLLAVGVAGIGCLMVVKDRLRVEISLDAPETDSLALVRDDFRSLQADFVALTQAMEQQVAASSQLASEQTEQRAASDRSIAAALAALDARLAEQGQRLQTIEHNQATGASSAKVPDAAATNVANPEPTVSVAGIANAGEPVVPTANAPAAATTAPDARKGFLGFRLPSRSYRFDQAQHYEILPDLSRVGFDAKSTLHDFSGVTTKVRGSFHANLASPTASFTGAIHCDARTLDSGVEGRDEAMRDHLLTTDHADITFTVESFAADAGGVDAEKMTLKGSVTGKMRIRGVEKPLTMPVTIAVDGSRRVTVEGQAKVSLPDYGVPVPDKVVIKMQPEVDVWVALRARPTAGGADAR